MAASNTEICNIALRQLREQPITSLTQDAEPARILNAIYNDTLDALLVRHPSNFAMRRQKLSQLSTAPIMEWDYAYTLPTDPYCLRAFKMWQNGDWRDEWVIEGRDLLTDYDNDVYLLYTARITDTLSYSPTFVDALAARLAADIAYPLTRDKALEKAENERAARKWRIHISADGGEGWQGQAFSGVFVTERE